MQLGIQGEDKSEHAPEGDGRGAVGTARAVQVRGNLHLSVEIRHIPKDRVHGEAARMQRAFGLYK